MNQIPESDETYVPVSRGFRPYQKTYTPAAQSMFLHFLFVADWRIESPDYGTLWAGFSELEEALGLSPNTVRRCLKELENGYPLGMLSRSRETAPPFISIEGVRGSSRAKRVKIRILKAKLSAQCFRPKNGDAKETPPLKPSRARARKAPVEVDPEQAAGEVEDVVSKLIDGVAGNLDARKMFEMGGK